MKGAVHAIAWLAGLSFGQATLGAPVLTAKPPLYVSPAGDDAADGHSPSSAFKSLQRANQEISRGAADTVYLLGGVFSQTTPLVLTGMPFTQRWLAAPGQHPVLDGGGTAEASLVVNGHDMVIDGIEIRGFAANGVILLGAERITISNCDIHDIASSAWNQAAILGMHVASHITLAHNRIANTGYAGILFGASAEGDLSAPRILGNVVENVCGKVADCGAIYLSGRTVRSAGAVVEDNVVRGYGPLTNGTVGIYLDDNLSGAIVRRNEISGRGSYAVLIHGGERNLVTANTIALNSGQFALFYQATDRPMAGNRFERNTIHTIHKTLQPLLRYDGKMQLPALIANKLLLPRR